MNKKERYLYIKIATSVVAFSLAFMRWFNIGNAESKMDSTFFLLIATSFLVFIIPWSRLKSLKAGDIELVLDESKVTGALDGIEMSRIENKMLRNSLLEYEEEIRDVIGSRVLWIDDKPHVVLGERRILRALGIIVVTARDRGTVNEILKEDNDFDLIISDIQEKIEVDGRETVYGGMYFVKDLRNNEDSVIKNLPVIFYTGFKPKDIPGILKSVPGAPIADTEICHTIQDLLILTIQTISDIRSKPIKVRSKKLPASIY